MKHSVSTRKELTILKLEEVVFDVRHADWFRETIDRLVSRDNSRNLIIDFSQVKAIDSCGISSMLLAHQLANQSEGLAIFVSLCQQIKDLLKLASLDKQLYIFSSINEVMTLIEPALKEKRSHRAKSHATPYDHHDEIVDEIELLPEEVFESESFPDLIDEHIDDSIDEQPVSAEEKTSDVEPAPKKRGRPKKNPQPDTGKSKAGQ
jgi:anti-anti-sigma factor